MYISYFNINMVNIWAILISMIFSVVLGFFWYGPLFGKKWMALSGIAMPEEKPGMSTMTKPIILSFVGAVFMVWTLTYLLAFHNGFYQTSGLAPALGVSVMLWLGFIVPVYLNFVGWEGKSKTLFAINAGYWLVFLLVASAIVNAFM